MMEYILESRRKTIEKQKQKYTTYKECPLCDGHFYSAKACLFRKHAKYINILHKKIKVSAAMSDSLTITGRLLLDKPDSEDEDSSDEEEEEGSDEEDSSDQNYMVIIHHEPKPLDEEDSSSDEGEYDLQEEQPITAFDKILEAIISIKTKKIPEDTHEDQWGEPGEGNDMLSSPNLSSAESEAEIDSGYGKLPSTPKDAKKFIVFGENPEDTPCELNLQNFENSICKVLPDTAEFPEDIFNIEGCVWCGSKGHDVLSCLGYANWLGSMWLGTLEERRLPYPQRQKEIEEMLKTVKNFYYNPRRPWELYTGLDDGEYLSEKGVKILIQDKKIVNLIPRHLQTTTTIYADLPTAKEMGRMLHLSTQVRPVEQLTVMDELCNQTISFKEDMIELEVELKRSLALQIQDLKKDFKQEMQKFYPALMDDRIAAMLHQFDSMRDFLSKSLMNLHQRSLHSDLTVVRVFRELFEARTPDSNIMWKRNVCRADPEYHLRGRWSQLTDRLNSIAEYTIQANLIVPITGDQHAAELQVMANSLTEVMQHMFLQAGVLEMEDLFDMEDFALFQEAVSRTLQLQAVSSNQVCNFIQQILYYNQCTAETFSTYMAQKRKLEVYLGILLQTTVKTWGKPGNCKCDFTEKLNCHHSHKYSILNQNFPDHGLVSIETLMDTLDSINNQTCGCSNHADLPMHGPSKYIKEPIPTYQQLQQMHLDLDPNLSRPEIQGLYVKAISSWIYARLYQYITPYTDPTMNQVFGPSNKEDWEFLHIERQFLENKLSAMDSEIPLSTILEQLCELGDLKKTYCQCDIHQQDRENCLLYQLNLPSTAENMQLICRIIKAKPQGFTAVISSRQQIIGTASQCSLLLYEVTPTKAGTFEAVEQHCRPQPHLHVKDTFFDYLDPTFVYVCSNKGEKHTINNLLAEVKGLPMVENATDGIEGFADSSDDTDSNKSTSGSSVPDLMESYYSCDIL